MARHVAVTPSNFLPVFSYLTAGSVAGTYAVVDQRELRLRTKAFATAVVFLCRGLPRTNEARLIGNQLFRSATSVGANYRAACRGRSRAEFIAKLGIVLEEADESAFWFELLTETGIGNPAALAPLLREANELSAIFVATLNTAKNRT